MVHGAKERLSAEHRAWIVVNALAVTAVINAVLNALFAWLGTRGVDEVPFFEPTPGETTVLTDSLGTLFVLPLITTLLVTTLVRHELREGALEPLLDAHFAVELADSRLLRGLAFGALTLSLLGLPVALALLASGIGDMNPGVFVAYKAVFGVILGALITPLIAVRALADRGYAAPGPVSAAA